MYKVIYVEAQFEMLGQVKTIEVPTGEKTKGLFGREKDVVKKEQQWQATGPSDRKVDGNKLSEDLETAINSLNNDGYEVISVNPVTSGKYDYHWDQQRGGHEAGGSGYGYGYGYSFTAGYTVVAKKNSQ